MNAPHLLQRVLTLNKAISSNELDEMAYSKEPATIYATACTDHYIPIRKLSPTHKHYTTDTHLCLTAIDSYRTACNLSTANDPYYSQPMTILARPTYIIWDHTTTVGLPYSLSRPMPVFPPTNTEPFDPMPLFGRLIPNTSDIRHQSRLNRYRPLTLIVSTDSILSYLAIINYLTLQQLL